MTPERSGGTLYLATETEPGTSRPRKRSGATRGPAPPSPGVRMRSAVGGGRAARRIALEDADTAEEQSFRFSGVRLDCSPVWPRRSSPPAEEGERGAENVERDEKGQTVGFAGERDWPVAGKRPGAGPPCDRQVRHQWEGGRGRGAGPGRQLEVLRAVCTW